MASRQITKAMEMVSASKMRKSQGFALDGRPYALAALEMLGNVMMRAEYWPPILKSREVKRGVLVVITSDKGLAGAFNSGVLRKAEKWLREYQQEHPVDVVTIGKKARDYFLIRKANVIKEFFGFGDFIDPKDTRPLSDFLVSGYLKGQWDRVDIIYTNFRSTLKQDVVEASLFPVDLEKIRETIRGIVPDYGRFSQADTPDSDTRIQHSALRIPAYHYEYTFEPSPDAVFESLIPHLVEMQVFHMILESNASEHSARMVAMKNASENAGDIISELTLQYNKTRQAGITRELTEITAGREALEV